mgnify:CR=1 FL=1
MLSGVPPGSVLDPILFVLCTFGLFQIVQYRIIGYADNTHIVVIPQPTDQVAVGRLLNEHFGKIHNWSDFCDMKLNPSKSFLSLGLRNLWM